MTIDVFALDPCSGVPLKRPIAGRGWTLNPSPAPVATRHQVWDNELLIPNLRVITTVEYTGADRGVEWHLSISERGGVFPSARSIARVRLDFQVLDFEQDDHGSRVAHLWLPVDPLKRGICDCKGE